MNTLLIHIGSPKTGTTALQNFLYDNAKELESYNWRYPDLKRELFELDSLRISKQINGNVFLNKDDTVDVDSYYWNQIWGRVLQHLKEKNVIISSEILFWDSATNIFLEGAKKKYDNIKVVVYLRRQDKFVESWWNQTIKQGTSCETNFIEYAYSDKMQNFVFYGRKLDQISTIVGKENLIVRIYEKEQLKNAASIASDFLSLLGIDPDSMELKKCKRHNPALSPNYLEIKSQINSVVDCENKLIRQYYRNSFLELSDKFVEKDEEKGFFTIEERKQFMKRFASENERIAREYLQRENGVLFFDQNMDIPQYKPHEFTSYDRDIIHVFTFLMEKVRKQNWTLAENLLLAQTRERKLAFFGAGNRADFFFDISKLRPNIFIDNNPDKRHKQMHGIEILSTEDIEEWKDYFVVIICLQTEEIEEMLQSKGLQEGYDYVTSNKYFGW